jgi:hypothetical protein
MNNALRDAHLRRLLPLNAPLGNPTVPQGVVQPTLEITDLTEAEDISTIVYIMKMIAFYHIQPLVKIL